MRADDQGIVFDSTMATPQIPLDPADLARSVDGDNQVHELAPDIAYKRLAIVNIAYFGEANAAGWVLIDAGVGGTANAIARAAEARFGTDTRPSAIVLTHGHFDHVGALETLAKKWDVPIYAHEHELPYLNGSASYPPADPSVGGGMMAALSRLYPRGPVDVRPWLKVLPRDGTVPAMPGWRWIHTPGHTPGHVSLWREADRSLIAGDAFVTTRQESVYAAATQEPEMHGPPMYYTPDWISAAESVRSLSSLDPELVITGHGRPMAGEGMRKALRELADRFEEVAVPESGRYVNAPETAAAGAAYHQP